MRLLNIETFETEDFFDGWTPPYTILSHTWGLEKDEITFHDIKTGRIKDAAARPTKLTGCCERTKKDGYKYIWIDTCCIDKTSAVELGEALNSMFCWYTNASICYAYLSDVPPSSTVNDAKSAISSSRWFTRGWTLQELLAPKELRFFGSTWSFLGTRSELSTTIEQITGISRPFLLGLVSLSEASVAQRMAWASRRVTKRKEDMAYCLLGIFNVTMPMVYGEGEQSFFRLQQAIIAHTDDDSILVWGLKLGNVASADVSKDQISGIFASKPADFAHCAHVVSPQGSRASLEVSGGRLRVRLPLYTTSRGKIYCLLNCRLESASGLRTLGVPLALNSAGGFAKEYFRPQGRLPISFPTTIESRTEQIEILIGHRRNAEMGPNRQNWFYIEDSSEIGLNLVEVHPLHRWQKHQSIITTDDANNDEITGIQQTLVRLRSNKHSTSDFIMLLEFDAHKSIDGEARCYVMICSKDTTLESLSQALHHLRPKMDGKQDASNGILNLRVLATRKSVVGQFMFTVQLKLMAQPPEKTIDGTEELRLIELHRRDIKSWFSRVSSGVKQSDEMRQYSHRIQELETTIKGLRQQNTELANKLLISEERGDHEAQVEELEATISDLQRQNEELAEKLLNAGRSNNNEAEVEVLENGLMEATAEDIASGLNVPTAQFNLLLLTRNRTTTNRLIIFGR
ncbi:heterokaryon incompatibility protein-domain-containing protein [Xylaria scruposa]|nr:heterokaryon incompatibility protein-domain-containing protein [Xylaria scruposa]